MTEQLIEASILLCVGMIVVFSFLSMLIAGIYGISWFAAKFPEQTNTKNNNNYKKTLPTTESQDATNNEVVAAISAAIHQHRSRVT